MIALFRRKLAGFKANGECRTDGCQEKAGSNDLMCRQHRAPLLPTTVDRVVASDWRVSNTGEHPRIFDEQGRRT